jgi:hypothetical protein
MLEILFFEYDILKTAPGRMKGTPYLFFVLAVLICQPHNDPLPIFSIEKIKNK